MSNLKLQKRLASKALKVGKKRVKIDSGMAEELKEAITRIDIKDLAKEGAVEVIGARGVSRHRARKRHLQKKKGRQRGQGKRKGKAGARTPKKEVWMNKIRGMRRELKALKDAGLDTETYRMLYRRAKGGFFRSKRHMLTYTEQHGLLKKLTKRPSSATKQHPPSTLRARPSQELPLQPVLPNKPSTTHPTSIKEGAKSKVSDDKKISGGDK